ncbi:ABC transporter substrate-binding protein [Cohnella sp.]|uniref:ABC transporter substrate-binding protein n=1 Tax=Cohnella sp. TaxID=1883426 RepID=UPI0037040DBA
MKKGWLAIVATGLILLVLAGCSSGEKENKGTSASASSGAGGPSSDQAGPDMSDPASQEKRKIVFATVAGYYTTALKEAAADYTKLNPQTEVVIDVIAGGGDAYPVNFNSKMAAGGKDAPDIIHTNAIGDLADNIEKGWFAKLNDFVNEPNPYNDGKTVFEGIDPAYHAYSYSRNGDVGLLPFDLVGTGFYYNKDIFAELGLAEPKTWEELFDILEQLKQTSYIPLAMNVDFLDWMEWAFVDWSSRSLYPELLIQPGDARYDEKVHAANKDIAYSPDDLDFDFGAAYDPEKTVIMGKEKKYDNQGPAEQKWWNILQKLAGYYQPGYQTADGPSVYSLFVAQKAAIYWSGSWEVGTLLDDQQKLGDRGFQWGTFKFPEFADPDPLFPGQPRGILVPGHQIGLTAKKDPEQVRRAGDFVKYLFSKDVAQRIFERTLEVGEFVQGPSLIVGVQLQDDVNSYLAGFKVAGNLGYAIRDLSVASIADQKPAWNANRFDFFDGKKSLKEFLAEKATFVDKYLDKQIADNQYDLDPKTNP